MTFNKVFFAIAILFSVVLLSCSKAYKCGCVDITQEKKIPENAHLVSSYKNGVTVYDTVYNVEVIEGNKGTSHGNACTKLQKKKRKKKKGVATYLCQPIK